MFTKAAGKFTKTAEKLAIMISSYLKLMDINFS
jgi:hypothetical protein